MDGVIPEVGLDEGRRRHTTASTSISSMSLNASSIQDIFGRWNQNQVGPPIIDIGQAYPHVEKDFEYDINDIRELRRQFKTHSISTMVEQKERLGSRSMKVIAMFHRSQDHRQRREIQKRQQEEEQKRLQEDAQQKLQEETQQKQQQQELVVVEEQKEEEHIPPPLPPRKEHI